MYYILIGQVKYLFSWIQPIQNSGTNQVYKWSGIFHGTETTCNKIMLSNISAFNVAKFLIQIMVGKISEVSWQE